MGFNRRGQIGMQMGIVTGMILFFVMAAIGAHIINNIGVTDTASTNFNINNQSLGTVTANVSKTINVSRIDTTTFRVMNASGGFVTGFIAAGNYTLLLWNDAFGNQMLNFTLNTDYGVGSNIYVNYTYAIYSGAARNISSSGGDSIESLSSIMTAYGTVAGATLVIALIGAIVILIRKN